MLFYNKLAEVPGVARGILETLKNKNWILKNLLKDNFIFFLCYPMVPMASLKKLQQIRSRAILRPAKANIYLNIDMLYIIGSTADDQKFFLEEATSALQASKTYQIKICAGTKSTKFSTVFEVRTPPLPCKKYTV